MVSLSRAAVLLATVVFAATALEAQDRGGAERAYFRAVASFFQVPRAEIAILSNWELPPDEIPVVLFMARRAGVSAEALVALRKSGRSWTDLAERYRIEARALHVPLPDRASAGTLAQVYERFRETPVAEWSTIRLGGADIVALVNVRVLAQSLGMRPEEIMQRTGSTATFVELYAQMIR